MKCPRCGKNVPAPIADKVSVYIHGIAGRPKVDVIILSCPDKDCKAILGAVNLPQS
jgi:hypothetical protein